MQQKTEFGQKISYDFEENEKADSKNTYKNFGSKRL